MPCSCVHNEQRALTGLQCARDLVCEVDVARRVDQVQLVSAPEHTHGLGLDRDPALALELHAVEHLLRISRQDNVCVTSRMRSASVDFPWSMWATMEKLRIGVEAAHS